MKIPLVALLAVSMLAGISAAPDAWAIIAIYSVPDATVGPGDTFSHQLDWAKGNNNTEPTMFSSPNSTQTGITISSSGLISWQTTDDHAGNAYTFSVNGSNGDVFDEVEFTITVSSIWNLELEGTIFNVIEGSRTEISSGDHLLISTPKDDLYDFTVSSTSSSFVFPAVDSTLLGGLRYVPATDKIGTIAASSAATDDYTEQGTFEEPIRITDIDVSDLSIKWREYSSNVTAKLEGQDFGESGAKLVHSTSEGTITTPPPNSLPVFATLDPWGLSIGNVDSPKTRTITATDADGDTISYSVENVTGGNSDNMDFDGPKFIPGTNDLLWNLTNSNYEDLYKYEGVYTVTLHASDEIGYDTLDYSIHVEFLPTYELFPPTTSYNQNSTITLTIVRDMPWEAGDTVKICTHDDNNCFATLTGHTDVDDFTREYPFDTTNTPDETKVHVSVTRPNSIAAPPSNHITIKANNLPVFDTYDTQSLFIGNVSPPNGTLNKIITANDTDGDAISFLILKDDITGGYSDNADFEGPEINNINDTAALLTWSPVGSSYEGEYTVTIRADDGSSYAPLPYIIQVTFVPFMFDDIEGGPLKAFVGDKPTSIYRSINVAGTNSGNFMYDISHVTGGYSDNANFVMPEIHNTRGELTWNPMTRDHAGDYVVTVRATNGPDTLTEDVPISIVPCFDHDSMRTDEKHQEDLKFLIDYTKSVANGPDYSAINEMFIGCELYPFVFNAAGFIVAHGTNSSNNNVLNVNNIDGTNSTKLFENISDSNPNNDWWAYDHLYHITGETLSKRSLLYNDGGYAIGAGYYIPSDDGPRKRSGDDNDWQKKPTFGKSWEVASYQLVENGFSFNGHTVDIVNNWHTDFPITSSVIGDTNTVHIKSHAADGFKWIKLYLGVPDRGKSSEAESSITLQLQRNHTSPVGYDITEIVHEQEEPLVNVESTSAMVEEVMCNDTSETVCYEFDIMFTVDAPLSHDVLALEAVDTKRRVTVTYLNEGVQFDGESLLDPATARIFSKLANQDDGVYIELTKQDRRYDVWVDDDGYLYYENRYGTFERVTQPDFERYADEPDSVMTRLHSEFGKVIQYEQERAKLVWDSSQIASELEDSYSIVTAKKHERMSPELLTEMEMQALLAQERSQNKMIYNWGW